MSAVVGGLLVVLVGLVAISEAIWLRRVAVAHAKQEEAVERMAGAESRDEFRAGLDLGMAAGRDLAELRKMRPWRQI